MQKIITIREKPTSPVLAPYIKYLWSMTAPESAAIDHWLVPVCNGDLVVNLSAPARCTLSDGTVSSLEGACVCGIRRQSVRIEQAGPIRVLGASFHPSGLYPFIQGAIEETVDRTLSAKLIMPDFSFALPDHAEVREIKALELLENSLLVMMEGTAVRKRVVPEIVTRFCATEGECMIKAFCTANSVHPRTLERYVKKYLGVTPQEYMGIARLQHAVRGLIDNPGIPLTQQAYEYGYYDQPHFTREFRGKFNRTPSDFIVRGNSVLETIRRR